MKKTLFAWLLILLILIVDPVSADIRNVQDNYELTYHIVDTAGDHVGSETVVLKIKRISDNYWYDFNDNTFKTSGWTNKSTNLSEDSTEGYYYYDFNPPASETGAEQYLFLVDNASATYGDHQSLIVDYQDVGNSDFNYASNQVIVTTNNDKTGYSLTQTFPSNFSSLAITGAGAVTAGTVSDKTGYTVSTVSDKTGYSLTQTFPTNFSSLAITGAGAVTAGTVGDKTGYALSGAGIDSIWDEVQTGHTTASSFGKYLDAQVSAVGGGTAADIADAVWDEALSGHTTTGSTGQKLNTTATIYDVGP